MLVKLPTLENEANDRKIPDGVDDHMIVSRGEGGGVLLEIWIYEEEENKWLHQKIEVSETTLSRAIRAVMG